LILKKEMKINKKVCLCQRQSNMRLRWDLFIILLAIYNSFEIPFTVAFPGTDLDNKYMKYAGNIIDVLFFVDIIVNFRTSIFNPKTGEEVTNWHSLAMSYLKGRFLIDFLATLPFDTVGGLFIPKRQSTLLNIFALLKLVRVLRLGRIITFLNLKSDIKMSFKIFKIIFFLIIYLHCIGCLWYWIIDLN
jgi:heme/copper-type cytochrome/quinol oxidase subunit 4